MLFSLVTYLSLGLQTGVTNILGVSDFFHMLRLLRGTIFLSKDGIDSFIIYQDTGEKNII